MFLCEFDFLSTLIFFDTFFKDSKIKGLLQSLCEKYDTLNALWLLQQMSFFLNWGLDVFKLINLYIYFWLRWVFVAAHRLSLVEASGGLLFVWCAGSRVQAQ